MVFMFYNIDTMCLNRSHKIDFLTAISYDEIKIKYIGRENIFPRTTLRILSFTYRESLTLADLIIGKLYELIRRVSKIWKQMTA